MEIKGPRRANVLIDEGLCHPSWEILPRAFPQSRARGLQATSPGVHLDELQRGSFVLKFSAFGGVPSGPACSPVGIVPLWLGAFGERACWRDVGLLVVSGFAGGKSFAGEALFEFCW